MKTILHTTADFYGSKGEKYPSYKTMDRLYITSGYRPFIPMWRCVCSVFVWHNETINIWMSLFLTFLNIGMCIRFAQYTKIGIEFSILFWLYGSMRCITWMNNVLYHTFICCSGNIGDSVSRNYYTDYYLSPIGIGMNIIYIEFYCYPNIHHIFCCIIGVFILSVICINHVFLENIYLRCAIINFIKFTEIGSPYIVGIIYSTFLVHNSTIPGYYLYFGMAYVCDLIAKFFASRSIPEKMFPIIFDNILSSQNIWYIFNIGVELFSAYFLYLMSLHSRNSQLC